MKAKYIPVNNNLDKAIAFANTLDSNNIKNIQKLKQPQHYIETLDVVKILQNEGWELSGVDEFRNNRSFTGTGWTMEYDVGDFMDGLEICQLFFDWLMDLKHYLLLSQCVYII
jgi:hypothetical protein